MENKIFIASTEPRSGKTLVTIGLINALQGIMPKIGYMKPIGRRTLSGGKADDDAMLVKGVFGLADEPDDINPAGFEDAQGDRDIMFEKIFDSYGRLKQGRDTMVIEGTDYSSAIPALEFDINAELAKNLGAPMILVAKGYNRAIDDIANQIVECAESFRNMGGSLLGTIVNRFDAHASWMETKRLTDVLEKNAIPLLGLVPHNSILSGPRLREVMKKLDAQVVLQGDDFSKVITDVKVLAMTPENALDYLKDQEGYLLIAPGDRIDTIFTAMLAQESNQYPQYSGLILTGGLVPDENVRRLLSGLSNSGLSILSVTDDTYTTALKVNGIGGEITVDDTEKLELASQTVERHINIDRIYSLLGSVDTEITTPKMFMYRILQTAKSDKKHIVLPEGEEPRILRATEEILQRDICQVTILGNKKSIEHTCRNLSIDVSLATIIHPSRAEKGVIEEYAETLYQLRKHKSVTREMALDLMIDPVYYATMMVYAGHADGFVSGSTHSTADTLGPVLRVIKTSEGVNLASSIFFMCMPNKVLVYGDCALVQNPNAEQLADIAITSAATAESFGIDPIIAMLSYSTGESGKGADVDKVREATEIVRKRRPDLPVEGPIQYDAAISEEVAKTKMTESDVAGKATVYIFPDLDAGNTAYKAVQRTGNVPAIGPVLQGLKKPANDLSRGATVEDIMYTIAITAIQAQKQ